MSENLLTPEEQAQFPGWVCNRVDRTVSCICTYADGAALQLWNVGRTWYAKWNARGEVLRHPDNPEFSRDGLVTGSMPADVLRGIADVHGSYDVPKAPQDAVGVWRAWWWSCQPDNQTHDTDTDKHRDAVVAAIAAQRVVEDIGLYPGRPQVQGAIKQIAEAVADLQRMMPEAVATAKETRQHFAAEFDRLKEDVDEARQQRDAWKAEAEEFAGRYNEASREYDEKVVIWESLIDGYCNAYERGPLWRRLWNVVKAWRYT